MRGRMLLSGLTLIAALPSSSKDRQALSTRVFTSPDDQFGVNSIIIEGAHEVMLVDAQLTKTSAEEVLREIRETRKPLSIVYITHEHADHFLGLEVFKQAYPGVRIIANSAVLERIKKVYLEKIEKWKGILGPGATSSAIKIDRFDAGFIEFEGTRMELIKSVRGDTDENTMLWIPEQRLLIAGDVVFDDMHVYTAETDSVARGEWLNTLKRIRALGPSVVIPGHGKVGAPLDARAAVDFTEKYLLVFEEELKRAKDPEGLVESMKARFPSAGLILSVERGAKANVKH